MAVLTLPEPPSANRWWRKFKNRMVLSPEARAYKKTIAKMVEADVLNGPVAITIEWFRGRRSGDLDKRLGVLLDALQGVIYVNDSQIVSIHAHRFDDKGNARVTVHAVEVPE